MAHACFPRKRPFTSTIDSRDSSFSIADVTSKNLRNKLFHVAMRLRSNKSQQETIKGTERASPI